MSLQEFREDRRQLGLSRAIARSLYYRFQGWVGCQVYRLVLITPQTVSPRLADDSAIEGFEVLDPSQLAELGRDPENHLAPHLLEFALSRGDICIGMIRDGRLANQGWYTQSQTVVDAPLAARFPARFMYMYAGYTRPEFRGEHLHGRSFAYALNYFAPRRIEGVIGFVDLVNYASLRSALRVGYRQLGWIVWPGFGRCWQSAGCLPYELNIEAMA